jgi:hypothetical protein
MITFLRTGMRQAAPRSVHCAPKPAESYGTGPQPGASGPIPPPGDLLLGHFTASGARKGANLGTSSASGPGLPQPGDPSRGLQRKRGDTATNFARLCDLVAPQTRLEAKELLFLFSFSHHRARQQCGEWSGIAITSPHLRGEFRAEEAPCQMTTFSCWSHSAQGCVPMAHPLRPPPALPRLQATPPRPQQAAG